MRAFPSVGVFLESRPSCNGKTEFRVIDVVRNIATPWLMGDIRVERAAYHAVLSYTKTKPMAEHETIRVHL